MTCMALISYLALHHLRERDKMLLRAVLCGREEGWNGLSLSESTGVDIRHGFCDATRGDGHFFWKCPFDLWHTCVKALSLPTCCDRTAPNGPDVFSGMAGSLACLPAFLVLLGQSQQAIWLVIVWK